jgi:hypothetical protein
VANGDDISTWDGSERLIQQAIDTFGTVDVVINNAGILRDRMLANMTEGLGMGQLDEESKAAFSPRWIAPIVTWLASVESAACTGRVFQVSGRELAIAEGWHRGPSTDPTDDPTEIGAKVEALLADARPNADMAGNDKA